MLQTFWTGLKPPIHINVAVGIAPEEVNKISFIVNGHFAQGR